jgi:hypothetical protein
MLHRFAWPRSRALIVVSLAILVALGAGLAVLRFREPGLPAGDTAGQRRAPAEALRYDSEYPSIRYAETQPNDAVARLAARVESGDLRLTFDAAGRGWLDSLIAALEIEPSSQVLVYSRTSLQSRRIRPETPRAIYFNDDVYVAWVQDGPLEIAAADPQLGVVYYTIEQRATEQARGPRPELVRELTSCLSCHDSYSLSGGGVPRFIVGSGYVGPTGELVSHEGWILVTDRTPLKSRWGGWYVTGRHGVDVHLGNMIIRGIEDFERLEDLRVGNIDDLDALFDTKPYLTNKSDIVALLVMEHQVNAQNAIVRFSYDTRTALAADPEGARAPSAATLARVEAAVEPLLETLLFVDQIDYAAPVSGLPEFTAQFASRAVRDAQGRSLRDLDLETRLFKYPLSYTIYSPSFDALPDAAKTAVYRRLAAILRGADGSGTFAGIAAADRAAIIEILAATKSDFARVAGN